MKIIEIQIINAKSEKVRARADVHFDGFWLKGFKVIWDEEGHKDYVTPPSYCSPMGWRPLFRTDSSDDWQKIQRRILDEYSVKQMKESADELKKED